MIDRVVVFDLPFPLIMEDLDSGGEIVVAGEPPAAIGLHLTPNTRPGIQSRGVVMGGDPHGRVTYTRVQARFETATSAEIEDWTDDELIAAAVEAVNRLIAHYRDVADQPLVRTVSKKHLMHYQLYDKVTPDEKPKPRLITRTPGPYLRMGMGPEEKAVDREVRNRVKVNSEPPVARMIELDIRARFAVGEYRLAVAETATLFEAWLYSSLRTALVSGGSSQQAAESRLLHPNGKPRSIHNMVTKLIPEITGYNGFAASAEFQQWDTARRLRNEIVHGNRLTVSAGEAKRAIDGIFAAVAHLQGQAGLAP